MGNHTAGRYVVMAATLIAERRADGETALDILDKAVAKAKENYDYSPDIEFDDDARPGEPFGDLLTEAFNPDYNPEHDIDADGDEGEVWFDTVYMPFKQRYGMC